ncbi:carbamate kinase [Pseudenhygromyxa sp. WMMC2535]|uniref:carbamate kinase n=1 Tax=Pseudenhygromyxa sp. WMMC2535 TaxID=2712867 RepID=UPI001557AEA3|nr:carbamate kinase [Pseudenhygromyxa sp. WMMC2535]NVB41321.1 carbamate kinase [Pseudenhygromyxa sp. WMMC2535]
MSTPTAVVAMGGHAFMQPGQRGTYAESTQNARRICAELMQLVERGYNLVLTHGNGPQVGDLLEQVERSRERVPAQPLDALVAQTEGSLGYLLQRALLNELRARSLRRYVVTVVTQVIVDAEDPAFATPTKPVGPAMTQAVAEQRAAQWGWEIGQDGQRGWRRVVPSPRPVKVIQRHMIREAALAGHLVIAAGGGGVPCVKEPESGDYVGIEAVIDKDLTSSVLATDVGADLLVILTAVDGVYLDFGGPNERRLGAVTMAECRRYIDAGHFPKGSMGPKVEAIYGFLERGGRRGLITDAEHLREALEGQAGTHFVGRI